MPPDPVPSDPDLVVLLLAERLEGGGPITRRLEKYGPGKCCACGGDTVPGRLYCSSTCRSGHRGRVTIELDGVTATPLQHARRIGMWPGTLYRRLQLGMTPIEALTRPVRVREPDAA